MANPAPDMTRGACALPGCTQTPPERRPGQVGRSQIYCSREHAHAAQRLRAAARQPGYRKENQRTCPSCGVEIGMYSRTCVRCHPRGNALPEAAASPVGERILELCRVRGDSLKVASRQAGLSPSEFQKLVGMPDRRVTSRTLKSLAAWDAELTATEWRRLAGGQTDGQSRLAKLERRQPGHHRRMSKAGREAALHNIESELQAQGVTETGTALRQLALSESARRANASVTPEIRSRASMKAQASVKKQLGPKSYERRMVDLRKKGEVRRVRALLTARLKRDSDDRDARELLQQLALGEKGGDLGPYLREGRRVVADSVSLLAGPRGPATREAVQRRALGHLWQGKDGAQVKRLRNYLKPPHPGPKKDRQGIPNGYRSAEGVFAIAAVVMHLKDHERWTLTEIGAAAGWHVYRHECPLASCFYHLARDLAKSSEWQSDWSEAYAGAKRNTNNLNWTRTPIISE